MRLSVSVNGSPIVRASLESEGWLSAHVNLSNGVDLDEPPHRVWISAYDRSEEPNSVASTWDGVSLSVGDTVEIEVLPDGESDTPTTVTRSSESPKNLFSSVEQARLLLSAVQICDAELWKVLNRVEEAEPEEELRKIRTAVGDILVELDRQLISPTLRRHPELLAEAEEKKLR